VQRNTPPIENHLYLPAGHPAHRTLGTNLGAPACYEGVTPMRNLLTSDAVAGHDSAKWCGVCSRMSVLPYGNVPGPTTGPSKARSSLEAEQDSKVAEPMRYATLGYASLKRLVAREMQ
jgi:hypothetical protein